MEKKTKTRGRPRVPDNKKRREMRTSMSARDADRLGVLSDMCGVSEGAILALLWRTMGESGWNSLLKLLCADVVDPEIARSVDASVDEGVQCGKIRVVSLTGKLWFDGESARAWILR